MVSNIQNSFTSSSPQATPFHITSKVFYESNWKDYLIIPSRAKDKSITGWKQFWSMFGKYVNKNLGSYSTLYRFQTGCTYITNLRCITKKLVASVTNQTSRILMTIYWMSV
ncbi:unnamed protein product [Ambrosiozyma monospora]|uniref:Unnamed protein product n=1 Tax=Ambrosiozyma monospora TaxID=43982 RepID=A0A9W6YSP6_AMBMO|nr:unnamed protein product [Ambrosiozyma monospora]